MECWVLGAGCAIEGTVRICVLDGVCLFLGGGVVVVFKADVG